MLQPLPKYKSFKAVTGLKQFLQHVNSNPLFFTNKSLVHINTLLQQQKPLWKSCGVALNRHPWGV